MTQTKITAIQEADLEEIGRFLHENLNKRISAQNWIGSLTHPWSESRPNFGAKLCDGEKLVGVFCAIYSDQRIGTAIEKFCNPHSWCVLPEYRNQGIGLVLHLVKQKGYHFTMLTPNPKVAEIFRHLKFKDLNQGLVVFPNLPSPSAMFSGALAESSTERIATLLSGDDLRDFELHRSIPWLRFVAFGKQGDMCLVVYKTSRWKRMPCARIIHVSNPQCFERYRGVLQNHLLLRQGLLVNQTETRFLKNLPTLAHLGKRTQAKLFMSPTLKDTQIRDLYSELASLDV